MTSIARLADRELRCPLATATSGDGCWTFKRVGFLQTRGEPLVRFRKIGGLLSLSSAVEITPAGAAST